ncbi:MAG: hypothetical protein ACI9TY_000975 [Alphaproteobacteria bacterium]|jgi:hypothetical protein
MYARTVSPDGVRVISGRRLNGQRIVKDSNIYIVDLKNSHLS